jgi:hypothetical protein
MVQRFDKNGFFSKKKKCSNPLFSYKSFILKGEINQNKIII